MSPRALRTAACLCTLAIPAVALAIDFPVTRYDDPDPDGCLLGGPPQLWDCSLREAVLASVAAPTDDRILLSAGTYLLTRPGAGEDEGLTGDLDLLGNVEILGPGATMTVIDAGGIGRIFDLRDSDAPGADAMRIAGVTLAGGIQELEHGGAALHAFGVDLTVEACELRDNLQDGPYVEGALRASLGSTLTLRDSSIRGNASDGVVIAEATATLTNVTISGNGDAGLAVIDGDVVCDHCTIRTGDQEQMAVWLPTYVGHLVLTLANSVVVGECWGDLYQVGMLSEGGNLESPGASCRLFHPSDLQNVPDPRLGDLADNGGPTSTHLPAGDSLVLGLALPPHCPPLDQRGASRDLDDCDGGAVQLVAADPPTPIFRDGFVQGDTEAWSATGLD